MMEKIRINSIEPKFGKPNEKGVCTPFWAIQTKDGRKMTIWDSQIADYMMKDVGLGGECSVEIKQKDQFTNIRAVDMKSAVPSGQILKEVQNGVRSLNGQEQEPGRRELMPTTSKDKSIIAQCLVKAVIGQPRTDGGLTTINAAVDMYKTALELLG